MNTSSLIATLLGFTLVANVVHAQSREPLCVTTEVRRLASAPYMRVNGSDYLVARAFPSPGREGPAFMIAVRDPEHTLRVGEARNLTRTIDEMEFDAPHRPTERDPGLTVLRVDRTMRVVGEGTFVPDPVRGERGEETFPPGIPVGVTVDEGVLVLEHIAGDLYALLVPASGAVAAPRRVAQAPAPARSDGHRGFVWITAAEHLRDGHREAIALTGTEEGEVFSLRFDGRGERVGEPRPWRQRVGGEMQLVAVPGGAPVAVLERPVRGVSLDGQQAREQVLVRLDDALEPLADPERLGLGPYPTTVVTRGRDVVVSQWAEARGFAIATLPVTDGTLRLELPRIWTTDPFVGIPLWHVSTRGAGSVIYDLMLHGDDVAGGLHAYLTYVPPAGTVYPRRDVLPLRARVVTRPALLPAEDGVVVIMATYDELGGGVDAAHVRCDMITLPLRR